MDILTSSAPSHFVRPDQFKEGEAYILIERGLCPGQPAQESVRFVGYSPCPATVIVRDGRNFNLFVARDRLFSGSAHD
jgi:hypothetical protein